MEKKNINEKRGSVKSSMKDFLTSNSEYVVIIISSVIGYFFGNRKKSLERYYAQSSDSLLTVYSKMYFALERMYTTTSFNKIEHIEEFFQEFNSIETPLLKLGNRKMIERFVRIESNYHLYVNSGKLNQEIFDEILLELVIFKDELEKEYWNSFKSQYHNYRWYQSTISLNFGVRLVAELFRYLKETLKFIIYVESLFILIIVTSLITKTEITKGFVDVTVFLLVIIVLCIAIIIPIDLSFRKHYRQGDGWLIKFISPRLEKHKDNKIVNHLLLGDEESSKRYIAKKRLVEKGEANKDFWNQ